MWMTIVSGLFASANAADEEMKETIPDNENYAQGPEMQLPTPEQLLEMLDSMTGISDEEKANLREELMKNIAGRASGGQQLASGDLTTQTFMLLFLLAIVALIFVFFVYKLFRCLKEREQKKEEKKKNKQLKKKK